MTGSTYGSWPRMPWDADPPGGPGIPGRPAPQRPDPWLPLQPGPPPSLPGIGLDRGLSPEVAEKLFERRIVLLSGYLDHHAATAASAQVMLLDHDGPSPITLQISCPDGDLDACVMLSESLDLLISPVHATAGGILGGAAVVVYATADHRAAHRHTALQLREPRMTTAGNADQLAGRIAQHQHQLDFLYQHVADACGQDVAKVITDMQASLLLAGEEAVRYGLVHELLTRPSRGKPPEPPAG
jgi:ATP-dependent Clp protease, protease subunit